MESVQPFLDTSTPDLPVRGFLHRPDAPTGDCLILTHGAGSNCRTPLLVALAEAFCAAGLTVLRCDLPFRQSRPTGPPPRGSAERDQAGLRAAVSAMQSETKGRIFLGGHSYGGRQASLLAASDPTPVAALLLLSFPLHPPQTPDRAPLQALSRPADAGPLRPRRTRRLCHASRNGSSTPTHPCAHAATPCPRRRARTPRRAQSTRTSASGCQRVSRVHRSN